MNEEEIKAKIEELEERERKATEKENDLIKREEDAANIGATIKAEYEKRLEALKVEYDKRLQSRDDIIKQLASQEEGKPRANFMDDMNEKRALQNRKW